MVSVDFGACLTGVLLLLVLPLNWLSAAFFAALFHEACHIAVIRILNGKILGVEIGAGGAKISVDRMETHRELLCALAGPVGSFLLIGMYQLFPRLALCASIQGMFNLLPVYPLDGGRVLLCALRILFPKYAETLAKLVECVCLLGIALLLVGIGIKLSLGN